MSLHSNLGASSRDRWANCAGSNKLIASLGSLPVVSRPSADRGTMLHEFAAGAIRAYLAGRTDAAMPQDDEDRDSVRFYLDEVVKIIERHASHRGWIAYVETKFALPRVHPHAFGTLDFAFYCPKCAFVEVVDYKSGFNEVEAFQNKQLMYYGVGGLLSEGWKIKTANLTIIQPQGYNPVKTWPVTSVQLFDEIDVIRREALATEAPDAPLKSGAWCKYCPASAVCPEQRNANFEIAKAEFTPVLQSYDPELLAACLRAIPRMEAWIESVRQFAHGEAAHGRPAPGFKLVAKRAGPRKWTDEQRAASMLAAADIVPCFVAPKLMSPAQIEKAHGKKAAALIEDLTERSSSGHTLVPNEDDRPAIATGPENDFVDETKRKI